MSKKIPENYFMTKFIQNIAFISYAVKYISLLKDQLQSEEDEQKKGQILIVEIIEGTYKKIETAVEFYKILISSKNKLKEDPKYKEFKDIINKLELNYSVRDIFEKYEKKLKQIREKDTQTPIDSRMYTITNTIKSKFFENVLSTDKYFPDPQWEKTGDSYKNKKNVESKVRIYKGYVNDWKLKIFSKEDISRILYPNVSPLKPDDKIWFESSDIKDGNGSSPQNIGLFIKRDTTVSRATLYDYDKITNKIPNNYNINNIEFPDEPVLNLLEDINEFVENYKKTDTKSAVEKNNMIITIKDKPIEESVQLYRTIATVYPLIDDSINKIKEFIAVKKYKQNTEKLLSLLDPKNFY